MNLRSSNVPEAKMMYLAKTKMQKSLDAIKYHKKIVRLRIKDIIKFNEIAKNRKTFALFCEMTGL